MNPQKTLSVKFWKQLPGLLLFVCFIFSLQINSFANPKRIPEKLVSGTVTDAATGKPLVSVSVEVRGKNISALTNADGYFSINADDSSTLVFSYVGYETFSVKTGSQTTIDIKMNERAKSLNEVVVTALGVKKSRRILGYSVTEVAGNSLTKARENNVMNALEGRVAGVNVSGVSTGPNSSANVVIRGVSSIAGSSQPLYVVDGIPMINQTNRSPDGNGYGGSDGGDGIGNINPDDIENISVLKGAAATALYGYRGKNGVILITTKSGKKGQGLGIEFNSNYVIESVIDNTDFQQEYGQGYGGYKPISQADAVGSGMNSYGALLDGTLTPQFDGVSRPYSANPGNMKRFYRNGGAATNTFSLSKGFGEFGNLRFSASDLDDNSIVPNAGLQRQSFDINIQLNPDKHFTAQIKATYFLQQVRNSPNVSDAPGNMNFAAMFMPPNINIANLYPGYDSRGYEVPFLDDEYTTNPYFAAYKFINNSNRNRFMGLADLKYTFDNGLYLQFRAGQDYIADKTISVTPTGTAYQPQGGMDKLDYTSSELTIDGIVGKNFKVNKDIALNTFIGATYRKASDESFDVNGSGFGTPFLYNIGNLPHVSTYNGLSTVVNKSVYASLDFSYKNYLYLTATGRSDWYSTLAPGRTNYTYPSISASFVFSELVHVSNMDYGKFRASYADVGGEADGPYETFLSYNLNGSINGFPIGNISNGVVPNSQLRPSSDKEIEIGTEMSFFKSRFKLDIAAYNRKITNSIIAATTSATSGYTGVFLNLGNLRNNGIEVLLTGSPVQKKYFDWSVELNATYNDNKVLALSTDAENYLLANSRAGEDEGQQAFIAQIVGMQAAQIVALDPKRDKNGNIILNTKTDAPNPAGASYKALGSGIDPWQMGITNEFTYKNLSLSFLVDGKFGGKIFSGTNYYAYQIGLSKETLPGRGLRFGTDSIYPQDYYGRWSIENSLFVYDASFIKLRQITFGYNLPKKWFHNKLQEVNISFVARNVLTLLKHTPNIDPESNYTNGEGQGLELAGVPYTRTYGFNLNVKL